MRDCKKNTSIVYVLNFKSKEKVVDGSGNYTGEETITYDDPQAFRGNVSGAKGNSQVDVFGTDIKYDKVIVITRDKFDKLKIDENSVFFIDKEPTYDTVITTSPLYNYHVSRIAKTLNEVAIAVKEV